MSVNLDKIKARIAALSNMTVANGASESEASTAAKLAAELMTEYNITLEEADIGKEKVGRRSFYTGYRVTLPYTTTAVKIGTLCDCLADKSKDDDGTVLVRFFGFEHDTLMAKHLMTIIHRAMHTEMEKFKETDAYKYTSANRRSLTKSFQLGFCNRINARIDALIAEKVRREREAAGISTGTSLILIAKANRILELFKKHNNRDFKTATVKQTAKSRVAYDHGQAGADKVNLNRPITQGDKRYALENS